MQIQREDANGDLYQMSLYTAGILFRSSPRQREGRRKLTSEAKKKINHRQREWQLAQLIHANFRPVRDLFVCLTYAEVPENPSRCMEKFHRVAKRVYQKMGLTYRYIAVTEAHKMDGEPVRVHHHLIVPGCYDNAAMDAIRAAWPHGTVDVQRLREGEELFRDTAIYLLKEDKPKGARRYATSRNLRPPNEPVRLRLPEAECGEVPPGVKIITHDIRANEYGRYEIMVGRIFDHAAFDAYWARQRKRANPDPWERIAKRRRRLRE